MNAPPSRPSKSYATLLGEIADEFSARQQRGDTPDIEEYAARHPELATVLREVLPLLATFDDTPPPPEENTQLDNDKTMVPPGEIAVGSKTGPAGYEILEELGRGGMGVVFKARQIRLNRLVAIKMILAGDYAQPAERVRFLNEAEVLARLKHPNIVQIHDIGTHDGRPFFSLEFIEGGSLADQLRGQPQPPRQAATLVELLAHGIEAAHECGIIHRDLKPANVLLQFEDCRSKIEKPDDQSAICNRQSAIPKITDFGLAKRGDSGLTNTGMVMGTPSYMAPEQAMGKRGVITPATDIYGLGAILYELLTGRPPFRAPTPMDTILQVLDEEPVPPSRFQSKTPRDLETICLKCLQKDPAKRYPAARGLAEDLNRFLEGRPIAARPVGQVERFWRWCRRNPAVAGLTAGVAAALLLGTAVSLVFAIQSSINAANEKTARELAQTNEQTANENAVESRRQVCRFAVENGDRVFQDGDVLRSLLWLAEPLLRDPQNPDVEEATRYRLAAYRRMSSLPVLKQVLLHGGPVGHGEYSPDGSRILTVCTSDTDPTARVWSAAACQDPLLVLKHPAALEHGSFSPDGRRIVTVCSDGSVRIWAAQTGFLLVTLSQPENNASSAVFSPDGTRIATTNKDRTARVWDTLTGMPVIPSLGHTGVPYNVAFSPDGRRVVAASRDTRVWDAVTGQPLTPPLSHGNHEARCATFSPDGRRVATSSTDNTVRIWDAATGKPVGPMMAGAGFMNFVAFSPDGRRVAACDGLAVWVWDAGNRQLLFTTPKQIGSASRVCFSPDGRRILTAGKDTTARVWDAHNGQPITPPLRHQAEVNSAAFSPDGRQVVTAGKDKTVRVWDLAGTPSSVASLSHTHGVLFARFSPDGSRIITCPRDETARLWDFASRREMTPPLRHQGQVLHAAFNLDGRFVATVGKDTLVRVWNAETGQLHLPPREYGVFHVDLSSDGSRLVTSAGDGRARLWDLTSDRLTPILLQHQDSVRQSVFSPDGSRVVTASMDKTARIWDAVTGQPLGAPMGHQDGLLCVAYSPDGSHIVTGSRDATARVWDAVTGQPRTALLQHRHGVVHVCFSPDGRRVLTGSADTTARVWDAATGQPLIPPLQHGATVWSADFSPDGRRIATASTDGMARVWDALTGLPLTPALLHPAFVGTTAFHPDGCHILTTSEDGVVRLWEVAPDKRPREDLPLLVRLLHGHRLDEQGALIPLTTEELRTAWETLHAKNAQDFTVSTSQVLSWHQREAEASKKEKNPAAVLLHTLRSCDPSWAIPTGLPRP